MDLAPFLTFAAAVLTALITVIGTIYVARSRTRIDISASITSGFKELTDQLQEERSQLSDIIKRQRDDLVLAERHNHRQEVALRQLRQQLATLKEQLESKRTNR